jgi:hypothetical protein
VVGRQHEVVAILVEVADPEGGRSAPALASALLGPEVRHEGLRAAIVLAHDEVDHPADRIGPVDG